MEDAQSATCDGCGAVVPLDQLSLTTFIEGEGFTCEECKGRETVVVPIGADAMQDMSADCAEVRQKMRAKILTLGDNELHELYYQAITLSEHEAARRIMEGVRPQRYTAPRDRRPEYNGGDVPPI